MMGFEKEDCARNCCRGTAAPQQVSEHVRAPGRIVCESGRIFRTARVDRTGDCRVEFKRMQQRVPWSERHGPRRSRDLTRSWFEDLDGDSHGGPSRRQMLCSPDPADDNIVTQSSGAMIRVFSVNGMSYSSVGDDCCDSTIRIAGNIFPGNTNPGIAPQTACTNVDPFDYDCSGTITDQFTSFGVEPPTGGCNRPGSGCPPTVWVGAVPPCGERGQIQRCTLSGATCIAGAPLDTLRTCM
jgi:hypothetical protein